MQRDGSPNAELQRKIAEKKKMERRSTTKTNLGASYKSSTMNLSNFGKVNTDTSPRSPGMKGKDGPNSPVLNDRCNEDHDKEINVLTGVFGAKMS